MSLFNLLPAFLCICITYATAWGISKFYPINPNQNKYPSLDGLRGYLAFFVFLHHAVIWYAFLKTGNWTSPSSAIFAHFGITTVTLFFMITGFLFWTKLIGPGNNNWGKILLSRFFRLVPLYSFMTLLVCIIVAFSTNFRLLEPPLNIVKELIRWSTEDILGNAPINTFRESGRIIANVTWTLPYEWMFYFSLPFFSLFCKNKAGAFYVLLSVITVCFIVYKVRPYPFQTISFGGGIAAAYFVNNKSLINLAKSKIGSVVCLLSVISGVSAFYISEVIYLILISFSFILIACGNDLFGLLKTKASHILGQMGYSIYLLHAISLYICFGMSFNKELTISKFWLIIFCLSPVVILVSQFTYIYIEKSFMDLFHRVIRKRTPQKISHINELEIVG